ncbi:MAG: helix-turn-helix domain-containing protein [Acidimicrobiales bacterium]
MKRTSVKDMNCSVAQCLEVIGDWWTMLIIRDVFLGVRRFDEIQERLGISRNVLTQRLDFLIEHEILERRPYQDNPPRYDYALTPRGRDLWPVLTAMRQWGDTWAAPDGPPVQLYHRPCGHVATAVPTCEHCGGALELHDIRVVAGPGSGDDGPLPARLRDQGEERGPRG